MRKLFFTLSLFLFFAFISAAQAPGFFNYQGVARNSVGVALINKSIGLRLTIRDAGGGLGTPVYSETRVVVTNAFGLFSVQVGGAGATNVIGTILGVNWKSGPKFMQVEIDPDGGTSFKDVGTTRLTSVPYALYANVAGDLVLPFIKSQGEDVPLFKVTNTNNNASSLSYEGLSSSTANNATAIRGIMTSVSPGFFSAGVTGRNNGTGINGFGVYGYQNGTGSGVYGETPGGVGVYGSSTTGIGVYGQSLAFGPSVKGYKNDNGQGEVGFFENISTINHFAALRVQTNGPGDATNVNMTGLGKGGVFTINNAASLANVMEFSTNGASGIVAALSNTNSANPSNVLDVRSNGLGKIGFLQNTNTANSANAFEVQTAGTGRTGLLQNTNATNASNVLEVQTNGSGKVGFLQNTNAANAANALEVQTAGIGRTELLQNTNTANASNVLEIQTNGMGKAGFLQNTNATNAANVLEVQTNGIGRVAVLENTNIANASNIFDARTGGTGRVGFLQNTNATNASNVVEVQTNGTGRAELLQNTNAVNTANVLEVQTNGIGKVGVLQNTNAANASNVLDANTNGTGRVGFMQNTNATNASNVIEVQTNGTGRAEFLQNTNTANTSNVLEVQTNGTGKVGVLQNTNAANASNVLDAKTNGTGRVGFLQNTNAANTSNVLEVQTNGSGRTGLLQNTNATNAANVLEVQTNGTGKVAVLENTNNTNNSNVLDAKTSGTGRVGFLQNTNATNAANVLEVQTNGTGRVGLFENTNNGNPNNVLDAKTNGTGRVAFMQNTNAANASNILEIQNNGTGKAVHIQSLNPSLATNALFVETNSGGYAAYIRNTRISPFGLALKTDGSVFINDATQSIDSVTGALVVRSGGIGVEGNLNVGGAAAFSGDVSFKAPVLFLSPLESTSSTTGSVTVVGGVGIGKRLNVAGFATISNATQSTTTTNGALVVSGGVGITKNTNMGGTLTVAGVTTINNTLNVNGSDSYIANFVNSTNSNGISIQVAAATPNNNNNFVTFKNSSGTTVGRIEGETIDELHANPDYILERKGYVFDVVVGAVSVGLATYNLGDRIAFQIEADASANVCAGLGVVACPPIASFVAGSIAEVIAAGVEEAVTIAETAVAATNLSDYTNNKESTVGVTYQSAAGDYAEFLMKQKLDETFIPGDIVGVKGGKISKNTEGAEKLMVISFKPIVLGNTPIAGAENKFEKVAFMGQVPVRVFGKVALGDYIIPNGVSNGVGIAVSPAKIDPKDVKNIVGIAWSSQDNAIGLGTINVAVGLNVNDNQKLIEQQQNEIADLRNQISQTNAQLEKLVPGFKAPAGTSAEVVQYKPTGKNAAQPVTVSEIQTAPVPVQLGPNEVHYVEASREDFLKGFDIVEERMKSNGKYARYEEFWKKFKSDSQFRNNLMDKLMKRYKEELDAHKALDAKLNK